MGFWENWDQAIRSENDTILAFYNDLYNYRLNRHEVHLKELLADDYKNIAELPEDWQAKFKADLKEVGFVVK